MAGLLERCGHGYARIGETSIGGYMPSENGSLHFEPGIVLRCLRAGGQWLVVDEINRADIDKAFGPLFSVLAGTGEERPHQDIELPFQQDKRSVHIQWSASAQEAGGEYVVTPLWRLIGTLNSSDKASLFQLSFAFLRRFALVEVPLPEKAAYQAWFAVASTASRSRCGPRSPPRRSTSPW